MLENIDSLGDTFDAKDVGIHEGTPNTNSLNTKSEKLERISTVANTPVGIDLDLLEHLGRLLVDLKSNFETGRAAIELATTVVGQDDGGSTVLDGELGVLGRTDTLDDDGKARHLLELLVVVPSDVGKVRIGGADTEAGGAVSVAIGSRVDGEDDGVGAGGLGSVKELLSFRIVGREVELCTVSVTSVLSVLRIWRLRMKATIPVER